MNTTKISRTILTIIALLLFTTCNSQDSSSDPRFFAGNIDNLLIQKPDHGYVTNMPASKWEEAMLTGNGTLGALVMGYPLKERIIFSHEKLFLPENPPTPAPDFGGSLDSIRQYVLDGDTKKAVDLSIKLGADVGLGEYYWTDPFIPACQMEIEVLDKNPLTNYSRSVNYETGEATTAWSTKKGQFKRSVFASRSDGVICTRFFSPVGNSSNLRIRLAELPHNDAKSENDQEFGRDYVIKDLIYTAGKDGIFKYTTHFRKEWDGSLKGYTVEARIVDYDGEMHTDGEWIYLNDCSDLTLLTDISLSYDFPVSAETCLESSEVFDYDKLLDRHSEIQGEMFNRFSLSLGNTKENYQTPDQLISSSSFGNLNSELVTELCEAARYIVISSTGDIPPSLVGIWGGTWRPEWSGDFTHNGNVPSIIAGGLNTNFPEIIEAYTDYMWSMMDDFRDNAKDLYGAPGIFVPSRSSDSGKTYHYGSWHPHLFWFAGGAWAAQIFYDYWQYTGDNQFLEEKAIPFMLEAVDFLEFIITEDEDGRFMFLPSYSPEVGPKKENFEGHDMLAINATMDIASLKQLLRNLLKLVDCGLLESDKVKVWENILHRLPDYGIDESGDLKEWIWPGFENNNKHRHASHLYPLFYEPDPEFLSNSELIKAASTAIENRLSYRRDKNGAEMAFGLVQMGLAAAHINDVEHAYECVDWLCNSYWSPAFTAYHDPGKIFNVDICGGLPAVITEMLVQSSSDKIILLPALPHQWPEGEVKGVGTRCGVILDLSWENSKPKSAVLHAQRNTSLSMQYMGRTWKFELEAGQTVVTRLNMPPDFWDEIPVSPSTTMPGQIKDDYWYSQFQRVNQEVAQANDTEIVFFGNSITWMWSLGSATGHDVWTKNYSAYKPINMGNSGDITPVMLYRLTHGNLDFAGGHQPRVAVLLCGTNNFVVTQSAGGDVKWDLGIDCPPEDVANGVRAVAQVFRRRLPQTRVIMMGILPVSDKTKWAKCQQVNSINAALTCNENEVAFIDLQDKFLQPDGSIIRELFTDGTHLTVDGYEVWAKSLDKLVREMMKAEPLDPVKIMLIGGSITEGANSDESYRRYLDGMLRREGILIDFVGSRKKHKDNQTEPDNYQYDIDHEGHWGKTSNWLAKNMPELIGNNVPDVAIIQMGTEDIISGSDSAGPLTDDIIDNISTVVKSLRSKNKSVKIVLANILPIQGNTDKVKLLNNKISSYIKANSTARSPVLMADLHTGFDPLADFTDDCVMPNASGARKMAEVIAEVIKVWR